MKNVLAIDLGGSKAAFRVAGDTEMDHVVSVPELGDSESEFDLIIAHLRSFLLLHEATDICGCVIATAAAISSDGRISHWPNRPYWTGFDLCTRFSHILQCPVMAEDDCNAAAYAESVGISESPLVFISIGTGIGCGVIINRKIYKGTTFSGPEIGHMQTGRQDALCVCGRKGCLQAYVSARAILSRLDLPGDTLFAKGQALRQLVDKKPAIAMELFKNGAEILGNAMISVTELFAPARIVIGGGFAAIFPELVQSAKNHFLSMRRNGLQLPDIHLARYHSKSSVAGAALIALNHYIQSVYLHKKNDARPI